MNSTIQPFIIAVLALVEYQLDIKVMHVKLDKTHIIREKYGLEVRK